MASLLPASGQLRPRYDIFSSRILCIAGNDLDPQPVFGVGIAVWAPHLPAGNFFFLFTTKGRAEPTRWWQRKPRPRGRFTKGATSRWGPLYDGSARQLPEIALTWPVAGEA
jgi:hypothetical protein